MHRSDCGLQFTSSTPILTPKECFEKTERELLIIVLLDKEMQKFVKICKAFLPRSFRVAHWHLSFRWLQTAYFPICVSLESHAIKHYICVYGLPKLHLHLSTCSFSTDCA